MQVYKYNPLVAVMASVLVVLTPLVHAQTSNPASSSAIPPAGQSIPSETLDKLVAPIALYPDALILQIVQCASSQFQVKQLSAWLKQHSDLKGSAVQDAAQKEGFDAEFIAIALFPDVVHMMAEQSDWTRDLGQAFTKDRDGVFDSIQRLRTEAQNLGNLTTTEQQTVQTVSTQGGQQVIVIQPANPQVVYVPQYNPQVVYTQPAPAQTTTTIVEKDDSGKVAAATLIGFAAGVIVGAAADDDDDHYYYACGGWGYHGPVLYRGGYNNYYQYRQNMANDYYQHRENMANDYYDHRENMAGQLGENQVARQSTRQTDQSNRQATASQWAGSAQTNRAAAASRGSFQNQSQFSSENINRSGAFSGYQRGSTERESSERGRSSLGSSLGGFSGGGDRFGSERGGFGGGGRGRR